MDQGSLVTEQIDAGAKLAIEFDKRIPLACAYWLKKGEDGQWLFYLASDQIDDSNFHLAYGEVGRILGPGPHVWLDPFQVKVRGITDPIAGEVLDLQQKYPAQLPMRLRSRLLGGVSVDEVYIYAIPVPVAA